MDESSKKLINQFHIIANKGWISNVCDNWGGVGLTFEDQLDKKPDSRYTPDYYDIEIKCTGRYSRYPLFLFTIALDGPTADEITRITEKYGHFDNDFPDKRVLFERISCESSSYNGCGNTFKLNVDYENQKIFICIYDLNGCLLEKEAYVNFSSLKNHLESKLKKMAVVYASKRTENKKYYFRYYKIVLYYLKSFDTFISFNSPKSSSDSSFG